MIPWLNPQKSPHFPNTQTAICEPADYNGLLAAGGCLNAQWLEQSYRRGIFPWFCAGEEILWWSPAPRMCILPESFRIPRTVRKLLKKSSHQTLINQDFQGVIEACAKPRGDDNAGWIHTNMIQAYCQLHTKGLAVSCELMDNSELVGGLYGVLIGEVFFGESMFSHQSNASKLAFAQFAQYLFANGIKLIDCQMHTQHLAQFGGVMLNRDEFEPYLKYTNKPSISLKAEI